ncbi:FMN-dependent NADH-azoreductase [Bradyrhizobium sp. AUGA SZCCT0182]|uniref:FMN-dependent NADH-azoreductase n=1 Tax=Bradyrhizobium sp. AUGA SZCCT0182 TaxID=2807667 RepID=UPI001BA9D341|nr:NAD(P)H-dependent oxidoreductase [Bradyrhizobium sp. AUGA SZCCT0182]MBR1237569.1 NAD(P)H-dependent oxidoreductase [Bradyrhizobium sp. AUGA SZCCT0182]
MKLLHLDSSLLGPHSVSRQLSAAIVQRLKTVTPGLEITYRDLAANPLGHLSGSHLAAAQDVESDAATTHDLAAGQTSLNEFLAADVVVLGAAMYNFAIASQLKAWIDRILVVGKTFQYGEKGLEGLAANKRVIIAVARGLLYGSGTPNAPGEHLVAYLSWIFGYMGIANPEFIVAEGTRLGPENREKSIEGALQAAAALRAV